MRSQLLGGAAGLMLAGSVVASISLQARAAQVPAFPAAADITTYRDTVERVFMKDRGGTVPGVAACVMCHTWQTSLRFALATPATDAGWTVEQSRKNFEVVTQLVNTDAPATSRLLLKPLAQAAGGMGHTGGAYWTSRTDPEYLALLKWIQGLPADRYKATTGPAIDFDFFRACVQPVFRNPREGHIRCSNCHNEGLIGFAPVPANGTAWNDQEANRAFSTILRLILPGDPEHSRFLLKPLHPNGGGSYTHNGPRRWQSRDDPEFRMLAGWVRGERKGTTCS